MSAKYSTLTREKGVEICTELLFKGKYRKDILQVIAKDYKASDGTVDKWIKLAKPKADALRKQAEKIKAEAFDSTITEALKEGLLSDIEIEVILCRIISGGLRVEEWIKGEIVLRGVTPAEQINAAKTIYQKRGSNEAPKLPKNKDGDPIEPIAITLNLN